ncbi:hypothetical protein DY000_02018790 [Brassica cretica]|uniref:Uncharacterized protein n=1 Tax=Brassica cretica TaxID=69181 RepID=A0ABQ7D025_BRACR|nr:hypothetical protein DY000_02018790 [Brassica cretica]
MRENGHVSSVESKTEWDRKSRVNRVEIIFFVSVLSFSLLGDFTRAQRSPPISTDPSLHGVISADFYPPLTPHRSVLSWSLSRQRSLRSRNHSHRLRSLVVSQLTAISPPISTDHSKKVDKADELDGGGDNKTVVWLEDVRALVGIQMRENGHVSSVESKTEWDRESRVNRVEIIFFVSVLSFSLLGDFTRAQRSPPISTDPSLHGVISADFYPPLTPHRSVLSWSLSRQRSLRSRNHSHRLRSLVVSQLTAISPPISTDHSVHRSLRRIDYKPDISHSSVLRYMFTI